MDPQHIDFMRQRMFIPVTQFSGLVPLFEVQIAGSIGVNMEVGLSHDTDAATVEGGAGLTALRTLQATAPNVLASAGVTGGLPSKVVEIGTLGLIGLKMITVGDDVAHTMIVPSIWDRHNPIYVRAIWASESVTGTDGVTWKFLYNELIPDAATALIKPATALDTAIVEDLVTATAKALQRSPAGIINRKSIADTALYWSFLVEADAQTGNPLTDGVYLLGVEFEYTPKHSHSAAPRREGHAWQV